MAPVSFSGTCIVICQDASRVSSSPLQQPNMKLLSRCSCFLWICFLTFLRQPTFSRENASFQTDHRWLGAPGSLHCPWCSCMAHSELAVLWRATKIVFSYFTLNIRNISEDVLQMSFPCSFFCLFIGELRQLVSLSSNLFCILKFQMAEHTLNGDQSGPRTSSSTTSTTHVAKI